MSAFKLCTIDIGSAVKSLTKVKRLDHLLATSTIDCHFSDRSSGVPPSSRRAEAEAEAVARVPHVGHLRPHRLRPQGGLRLSQPGSDS